jgi:hypothetical protein
VHALGKHSMNILWMSDELKRLDMLEEKSRDTCDAGKDMNQYS